jgi:hypothetical protein
MYRDGLLKEFSGGGTQVIITLEGLINFNRREYNGS